MGVSNGPAKYGCCAAAVSPLLPPSQALWDLYKSTFYTYSHPLAMCSLTLVHADHPSVSALDPMPEDVDVIMPHTVSDGPDTNLHSSLESMLAWEVASVVGQDGQPTGTYKDLLRWVDVMEAKIWQTRSSIGGLGTVATVDVVVALSKRYLNALEEDINWQETRHKWFLQDG